MGGGTSSGSQHTQYVLDTLSQPDAPVAMLASTTVHGDMSPHNVVRESRKSLEHPDPTTVLVAFDVTGSMGTIPEAVMTDARGLSVLFDELQTRIPHPQLGFSAVGDSKARQRSYYSRYHVAAGTCDTAPFQFGQFESDNRAADNLGSIWREGGGGGNGGESYHLAWLFAYNQCILDSWGQGRKGILITVGDECVHAEIQPDEIRAVLDSSYDGPALSNEALLAQIQERFVVFHIAINDRTAQHQHSIAAWQALLGDQVCVVDESADIAPMITSVILDNIMPLARERWGMEPIPERLLLWSPETHEPWHVPPVQRVHMLELSIRQGFFALLGHDDVNLHDQNLRHAIHLCATHLSNAKPSDDFPEVMPGVLNQVDLTNPATRALIVSLSDELMAWHQLREDTANQDEMPALKTITPVEDVVADAVVMHDEPDVFDGTVFTQRY